MKFASCRLREDMCAQAPRLCIVLGWWHFRVSEYKRYAALSGLHLPARWSHA